ncbi:MAG: NusA-like transcription termination signal-binding factor [Candidatus Nanoarchaeia archaeon]
MGIKYNLNLMNYRTVIENVTRCSVKDCFLREDNSIIVIVKEGDMGKVIGKGGVNIKHLEQKMNKKLKIVEYNEDVTKFVGNLIAPITAKTITNEDNTITISLPSTREKGQIIGRDSKNLIEIKKIVSMYFDIVDIKVS